MDSSFVDSSSSNLSSLHHRYHKSQKMIDGDVDDTSEDSTDSDSVERYLSSYHRSQMPDDTHTTSSFEMIEPQQHLENQHYEQNQMHRPHSVLGFGDHHTSSSAYSSAPSPAAAAAAAANVCHNNANTKASCPNGKGYHTSASCDQINSEKDQKPPEPQQRRKPNGVRLPVPLPRSKSFHQILRSTHNGQILASKGTIRGASDNQSHHLSSPPDIPTEQSEQNHFLSKKVFPFFLVIPTRILFDDQIILTIVKWNYHAKQCIMACVCVRLYEV